MVRVGLGGAACRIYWASISVGRVWRDPISWKQQPNPLESALVTRLGEREGDGFSDEKQKGRKQQTISKIVTTGGLEETTKEEATPRIKLFGKRILKKGCG